MIEQQQHVILGAGPVGRAVVAHLGKRGIASRVVTRSGTALAGAVTVKADVSDPAQAKEVIDGADVVYQCAQPAYHQWVDEFLPFQRSIVDACANTDALYVAVENLYGYGLVTQPMVETLPLTATTRKGEVRAEMWRELDSAHQAGKVRVVSARAADFFGPWVTESALGSRFFGPLLKGKGAGFVGNPDLLHTFTYVPDLARALVDLADKPNMWGQAWHVPNAPAMTVRTIVEIASAIAGVDPKVRVMPRWQLRLGGVVIPAARESVEMLYQFENDFVVDHSAYTAVLGDHATPIEESIARTIEFHGNKSPKPSTI